MIEITSRYDRSRVLYRAENAQDTRAAVEAADPSSPLFGTRLDFWSILDLTPAEVPGLRLALTEGRVDGSTYTGECACLVGTIERVARGAGATVDLPHLDTRPAESWFIPIRRGATNRPTRRKTRASSERRWPCSG